MPYSNTAGLNVNNFYGARSTGYVVGMEDGLNSHKRLTIEFTGESLNSSFLPPLKVPKGSLIERITLRVDEAFTVGGTSPVVNFGSSGSVATNGVTVTGAELGTVGTKVPASTGNGTWSTSSTTGLTAGALVAFALGGTSPTVTSGVGKATLIVQFIDRAKA